MRRLAAVAGMLLGSCGTTATCPGQEQGTLTFAFQARSPPPAGTCEFFRTLIEDAKTPAALPSTRFTAIVSWRPTAADPLGAALCVQAPLAQDKIGTYGAIGPGLYALDFPNLPSATAPPEAIGTCPCAVELQEALSGQLKRSADQALSFSGTLVAVLTRSASSEAAACYAAQSALPDSPLSSCPPEAQSCTVEYVAP